MKNVIQDYAWGSPTAIPELLGSENRENTPQAELWMGSHRRGTSLLQSDEGEIPLSDFISDDIKNVLGDEVASSYGDLPFLFKVLAAGSPLSIQVHPDKKQAEEGYLKENRQSIPLDAYNRNYKDDNHKPEIICALTPFWAMRGFRTFDKIVSNFQEADLDCFREEVDIFSSNRTSEGLQRFFSAIMALDGAEKQEFINELVRNARKLEGNTFQWVLKLHDKYPEDAAIAGPMYLNLVQLQPGEALYLSAGELHAYLDGLGMELMASSDNVLRGGLTPKYVDGEELTAILNFSGADPEILTGRFSERGISLYDSPSREFQLSKIDVNGKNDYLIDEKNNVQILFISEGSLTFISEKGDQIAVEKGDSLFVPFHSGPWTAEGSAVMFRASVPGEGQ